MHIFHGMPAWITIIDFTSTKHFWAWEPAQLAFGTEINGTNYKLELSLVDFWQKLCESVETQLIYKKNTYAILLYAFKIIY